MKIKKLLHEIFPYKQYDGWHFRYYVFFVGEGIFNPNFSDYSGGRLEVRVDEELYSINEYRYFTKRKSFFKFSNFIECHHYNAIGLFIIKMILKFYHEKV